MKRLTLSLLLCASAIASACAAEHADSTIEHKIVITGDPTAPGQADNVAELNSEFNLAFEDPAAPRFLFFDKEGAVALGIGGYLKAVGIYDFDGSIDNDMFYTNKIPVPFDPAQNQRLSASASHSTIFLKAVTRPTRLGRIIVYIQTDFTGNNGNYGLRLRQAYITVGHLTIGKARSTFADGPAMAPTIEDQGPSGQVNAKNMMIQYISPSYGGFTWAISGELPSATYTPDDKVQSISQRFPDIPFDIQYSWGRKGVDNHVRLTGMLRQLAYRDLVSGNNKLATGWGVQLSAVSEIYGGLKAFGHYTYGKGIGYYINDLSGCGYDLIPSSTPGHMRAPAMCGWTAGLQYNFSKKLFVSGAYSRAQLYGAAELGGDTYRYGQYIVGNAFYTLLTDLRLGVEYLHGTRKNYDGRSGHANRIQAMVQYTF